MHFQPPHCPFESCPARAAQHARPFLWRRRGRYQRLCDGRLVPRFLCLTCGRSFSSQTFRVDYRLRRPLLHIELFGLLISKVSLRQAARILHARRRTIEHRQVLLGRHAREFQFDQVRRCGGTPLRGGVYLLDEMETFEGSRKLGPISVPMLAERKSGFVVDVRTATLPMRGHLSPGQRARKAEIESREGKRRSTSSAAVRACLETLETQLAPGAWVTLVTDAKPSYPSLIRSVVRRPSRHIRIPSAVRKSTHHPLFILHVMQAMLRDGLSRMVRRTWTHTKRREQLEVANWIWVAWRNWVRYRTNKDRTRSPAMLAGVTDQFWSVAELFRWRIFDRAPG